jgi:hypothetical protein
MAVDLAGLAVLAQQAAEDTLAAHPEDLGRHAGVGGTLALSGAGVAALALGREQLECALARVDGRGLDDDAVVLEELLDVCARVGVADFALLVRVEPNFALANTGDGRGEPLLGTQIDHLVLGQAGRQHWVGSGEELGGRTVLNWGWLEVVVSRPSTAAASGAAAPTPWVDCTVLSGRPARHVTR